MSIHDYAGDPVELPKDWRPYSEQAGTIGSAVVRIAGPKADADGDERDLLLKGGFNPDHWSIKPGSLHYRCWQRADGEWLNYFKYDVLKGSETKAQRDLDVEALVDRISLPRTPRRAPRNGDDCFLVVLSDWQTGKGEGDGTPGTIARVEDALQQIIDYLERQRRAGALMPHLAIAGTGDLGEGTCNFFANQAFVTDLNRRDQNRVNRRLLTLYINELLPLFEDAVVLTVGGNHGENRENGRKQTDDGDNDDVAIFEGVKEAFDMAGTNNIDWRIPNDELSMTADLGGVPVGFVHGHQFYTGATPAAKAATWWKNQTFGDQPVGRAQLLFSSHFHHFTVTEHGHRTHIQTPAMDPGSKWVTDTMGSDAAAGILTVRLDGNLSRGYDDLKIHHARRG